MNFSSSNIFTIVKNVFLLCDGNFIVLAEPQCLT